MEWKRRKWNEKEENARKKNKMNEKRKWEKREENELKCKNKRKQKVGIYSNLRSLKHSTYSHLVSNQETIIK